jgi:HK97 family phage portal protein
MAWNSTNNKSIDGSEQRKHAAVGPGAPIATNPTLAGQPYFDPWDIERAYREGMQKVTWVARCVDVIAGNQARLPVILREGNAPDGKLVTSSSVMRESTILDILNTKSNIGENSFIFRYRLSAQLLMSSRGAFIEKVRSRDGRIIGLNLLPPQHTAPVPHPKTFVSGYEVAMPDGKKVRLKPEDVVWVRRPHPLDPYLSMTPMESAGVAIEIENLAKLYNRNFLLNDGRPGGLLVLRGEIDDDDKNELRSRFRGNLGRVGSTTVVAADDGVDFVDTSSSPRDAAYIQMRTITKEEIFAAFGVPETVIGNASGRTFSNAGEEIRVFWMETMLPHLEPIARALDEIDPIHYIDFDTSTVPNLIIYKQERDRYLMDELQNGLISINEYRDMTGKETVKSDLADSLLMNPNLTPVANTEKEMEQPNAMMGGQPGMMPPQPGMPTPGAEGPQPGEQPLDPNTMQGSLAQEQESPPAAGPPAEAAPNMGQLSGEPFDIETKEDDLGVDYERWTGILDRSFERLFERQQRVILEKAAGRKARTLLTEGTLDIKNIMTLGTWDRQMDEDIRPVLNSIIKDSQEKQSNESDEYEPPSGEDVQVQLNAQMDRIKSINLDTEQIINQKITTCMTLQDEDRRHAAVKGELVSVFASLLAKAPAALAEDEARRAWVFPIS